MLFRRLYNWIKNKILPTSFLFKNRLFIERESKHRRIYNMFGSIFRNSKWGNYDLTNLKMQLRSQFYYFSLRACVWSFVITIVYVKKHWGDASLNDQFCNLSWMCFECVQYYSAFVVWTALHIFCALLNWFYSYFLSKIFKAIATPKESEERAFFRSYNEEYKNKTDQNIFATYDIFDMYQTWLTFLESQNRTSNLRKLFSTKLNTKFLYSGTPVIKKLFYSLYPKNVFGNLEMDHFALKYIFKLIQDCTPVCENNLNNYSKPLHSTNSQFMTDLNYLIQNQTSYFNGDFTTPFQIYTSQNWNFTNIEIEKYRNPQLPKVIRSAFYLDAANHAALNCLRNQPVNIPNITSYTKNQLSAAKWNRWLYRYSILHRRILKNSHKLTVTKRLFQSGFYSDDLSARNTWVNHRAPKFEKSLATHLNILYYSRFFCHEALNTWTTTRPEQPQTLNQNLKMSLFSFYENGFFWFLKRFYFFNTIPANNIKSIYRNKLMILEPQEISDKLISYLTLTEGLASSYSNNIVDFFFINTAPFKIKNYVSNHTSPYLNKDFFLMFADDDLLSSETLDVLYWISHNPSTDDSAPKFFYIDFKIVTPNFPAISTQLYDSVFKFNYLTLYDKRKWLDSVFLIDLVHFTYFV